MLNLKNNKTYNGLKYYHKITILGKTYFGTKFDIKQLVEIVLINNKKTFFISIGSRIIPKLLIIKSPDDIKVDNYTLEVFNRTQLTDNDDLSDVYRIKDTDLQNTNIYEKNFIDSTSSNSDIGESTEDFVNTTTSVIFIDELINDCTNHDIVDCNNNCNCDDYCDCNSSCNDDCNCNDSSCYDSNLGIDNNSDCSGVSDWGGSDCGSSDWGGSDCGSSDWGSSDY